MYCSEEAASFDVSSGLGVVAGLAVAQPVSKKRKDAPAMSWMRNRKKDFFIIEVAISVNA